VEGRYIKNEFNDTVYLRGACFGGMGESGLPYWNGGIDKLVQMTNAYVSLSGHDVDSNRANVIRVCTGIIPGHGWDPSVMDSAVDDIVSLARANGIYVVVEFHGGLGQNESAQLANDPSPWINWFLHWVNRYANESTVCGFEIFNEPYAPDFGEGNSTLGQERWVSIVEQMVGNVTAVNPKALILVSSAFPGYNWVGENWILSPLVGNVVYTWDWYYKDFPGDIAEAYAAGLYDYGKSLMDKAVYLASGRAVVEGNLSVLNSEFGFNPGEYGSVREMCDYFEAMNKYDNNWYEFWWWSNSDNQGLVTDDYRQLSEQGIVWASYLWSGNPTSDPVAVPIPFAEPTFPVFPSPSHTLANSSSPTPETIPVVPATPSQKPSVTPSQVSPSSPDSEGKVSAGPAIAVGAFTVATIVFFAFSLRKGHLGLLISKFVFRARAVFRKVSKFLRSL